MIEMKLAPMFMRLQHGNSHHLVSRNLLIIDCNKMRCIAQQIK